MNGAVHAGLTIALLACAGFGCASTPPAAPSSGGCAVDLWIISWNADDAGVNDEQEAIDHPEVHERVETCSYADAVRGWLEHAPAKTIKQPEKGVDVSPDLRVVARVTSGHGSDLVGVNGSCDWVRRNRKQYLEYDPSLFNILIQPLQGAARHELDIYLSHPGCGPKAAPH
jgi:hypothetical protein